MVLDRDETELAVKYLENLPKVPRFNMIIMCLSPADKSGMSSVLGIYDDSTAGVANSGPIQNMTQK